MKEWTKSKFWSYIRSTLRRAWMRYPERQKAIMAAYVKQGINDETGRKCKLYRCSDCGGIFPLSKVDVDHVTPVGRLKDFDDLPQFVKNLFCESDKLTILCKECHKKKTKRERQEAAKGKGEPSKELV